MGAQISDHDRAFDMAIAHQLCAPLASYVLNRGEAVLTVGENASTMCAQNLNLIAFGVACSAFDDLSILGS